MSKGPWTKHSILFSLADAAALVVALATIALAEERAGEVDREGSGSEEDRGSGAASWSPCYVVQCGTE